MGHAAVANLTAKGRATRERIVRVASEQMLQRGVVRTTIEDIEKAANVSTSQMYHYFADKDDLVAAVIDLQSSQVLGRQQLALRPLDSIAAMVRWRNAVVDVMRGRGCVGGCPIGSLANELSDTDPLARARLASAFAQWEDMIRAGLTAIVERGELPSESDVNRLAMAVLACVQGGLLLSQLRRDTEPLEAALDTMIDHLRGMGVR
jgi:TetR/AcrR family transcriptional regulator, transcriptional repressor for nem operon